MSEDQRGGGEPTKTKEAIFVRTPNVTKTSCLLSYSSVGQFTPSTQKHTSATILHLTEGSVFGYAVFMVEEQRGCSIWHCHDTSSNLDVRQLNGLVVYLVMSE